MVYAADLEISANFGEADGSASSPVSDEAQSVSNLNLDKFQSSRSFEALVGALFIFSAMAPLVCVIVGIVISWPRLVAPTEAVGVSIATLLLVLFETRGFFAVDATDPAVEECAGTLESLLSLLGVGAVAESSSIPSAFCSSCNVVLRNTFEHRK